MLTALSRDPQPGPLRIRLFWGNTFLRLTIILAVTLIVLTAIWASRNEKTWLGVPDWQGYLFPWHPVLMICGFYVGQTLAICSIHFSEHIPTVSGDIFSFQKLLHILFHIIALGTLIPALYAAFKTRAMSDYSHLATSHEWLGILIAILYVFQFTTGLLMQSYRVLLVYQAGRHILSMQQYMQGIIFYNFTRNWQKSVGWLIFLLVTWNILSGVVQLQLACPYYVPKYDTNADYSGLPSGCKISNGIVVLVIITSLSTVLAVSFTYKVTARDMDRSSSEAVADQQIIQDWWRQNRRLTLERLEHQQQQQQNGEETKMETRRVGGMLLPVTRS